MFKTKKDVSFLKLTFYRGKANDVKMYVSINKQIVLTMG